MASACACHRGAHDTSTLNDSTEQRTTSTPTSSVPHCSFTLDCFTTDSNSCRRCSRGPFCVAIPHSLCRLNSESDNKDKLSGTEEQDTHAMSVTEEQDKRREKSECCRKPALRQETHPRGAWLGADPAGTCAVCPAAQTCTVACRPPLASTHGCPRPAAFPSRTAEEPP
jgi:hypothetical protein